MGFFKIDKKFFKYSGSSDFCFEPAIAVSIGAIPYLAQAKLCI